MRRFESFPALGLSPSPLGGEGWGEGCFLHEKHQTPFAPSARAAGVSRGHVRPHPSASFPRRRESSFAFRCHPPTTTSGAGSERNEESGLTPSEAVQRALARVPNPPERLYEVFRLRRVTFLGARKVTKRTFPGVCAVQSQGDWTVPCASRPRWGPSTGQPWPDAGRFGILPRPRLRAADPPRPAMLGAARRGGTSKAKAQRHFPIIVIPAKAGIQGPKQCTPLPTPHPNPLPQGERGLRAEPARLTNPQ